MYVVPMTTLAVARRPGATVLALAGEVVVVVARTWGLVRRGATVLRRRRPVWATPTRQLLTAGAPLVVGVPHLAAPGFVGPAGRGAPTRRELVLPDDPTAPGRARAVLAAAVGEWDLDDELYQDAAMVATELVANVVDHAGTPSTLTLALDDRGLCVAVRDGHRGPVPRPGPVDPGAPRGRGLQMVAALACSWGVTTHLDGKTVWAVLPRR